MVWWLAGLGTGGGRLAWRRGGAPDWLAHLQLSPELLAVMVAEGPSGTEQERARQQPREERRGGGEEAASMDCAPDTYMWIFLSARPCKDQTSDSGSLVGLTLAQYTSIIGGFARLTVVL